MIIDAKNLEKALDFCTYCPKLCTFACPVSNAEKKESVTPWAKMTLANLLYQGHIDIDEETVEPLYHCLACNLCTTYCKHDIEVGEMLTHMRRRLVQKGVKHQNLTHLPERWKSHGHPYENGLHEKLHTLLDEALFEPEANVIYFPSAATIAKRPLDITATFSVFEKLGINFVACYTGQDLSAGLPLYRAGYIRQFEAVAFRVARKLSGYKLIVTANAEEAYALKMLYPQLGYALEGKVVHLGEFLRPYLDSADFVSALDQRPFYHVPAHLARHLGEPDAPKRLLGKLFVHPIAESSYSGSSAYPTGQAPIYSDIDNQSALDIAKERIRQIKEARADWVVTASAEAASRLELAQSDEKEKLTITTLAELLDKQLPPG